MSAIRRTLTACVTAGAAALLLSWIIASPSWAVTVTPLASGLDNPRDLAFDSDGDLFVAEAGHGSEPAGSECASEGPGGESACVGFTSGVSKVEGDGAHRVFSGEVSLAGPDGTAATGTDGISILGDWRIFSVETESEFSVPPTGFSKEATERAKAELGRLDEHTPGNGRVIANVGAFDFKWSEEHKSLVEEEFEGKRVSQFPDANPYGVLATGDGFWVVDAASNTIDWVSNSGSIRIAAFIPNPPVSDAVPTCIDKGPDGALYVGELLGGGNSPGAGAVWRFEPWDGDLTKWAEGLTAVTGCGFDSDGDFYAVEFSTLGFETFQPETGALVRVPPHSTTPVTVVDKLSFPGGFAAQGDSVYLSNWSIAPAKGAPGGVSGEVLRVLVEGQDEGLAHAPGSRPASAPATSTPQSGPANGAPQGEPATASLLRGPATTSLLGGSTKATSHSHKAARKRCKAKKRRRRARCAAKRAKRAKRR